MSSLVIETDNLTKTFKGFTPVDSLSLNVKKGEIYGFLGPNGAGKTTTIRMLLGLIRPTKGEVRIFDKSLAHHRIEIAKKVGSLVESPSYYGHLTGYENLEITRKLLNADRQDIDRTLEIVRLTEWKHKDVRVRYDYLLTKSEQADLGPWGVMLGELVYLWAMFMPIGITLIAAIVHYREFSFIRRVCALSGYRCPWHCQLPALD